MLKNASITSIVQHWNPTSQNLNRLQKSGIAQQNSSLPNVIRGARVLQEKNVLARKGLVASFFDSNQDPKLKNYQKVNLLHSKKHNFNWASQPFGEDY